jgi:hypothetical protein
VNIYQRIIAVQKTCTYVKKDSEVGYGKNAYKAVSHDAVQEVVRQAMIDNEMVVMVSQQGKGEHYDGETKSGTANIRFEAVYDVSFICADKPEDRHTVSIEAHGEDFNDKGPGKAISYAVKTAFLKTFQLATGEDDEARLEERGTQKKPATTSSTSKPAASGSSQSNSEKPWFNDFSKQRDNMIDRIGSGEQTGQQIIDSLSENYKLSKKTKDDILALDSGSDPF